MWRHRWVSVIITLALVVTLRDDSVTARSGVLMGWNREFGTRSRIRSAI